MKATTDILNQLRMVFIQEDICPECLGELDTGFECNKCGYDAQPYLEEQANVQDER